MFDVIGRFAAYFAGAFISVAPACIALDLAGGVPSYAIVIVGVASAVAGAGGVTIMRRALKVG